MARRVDRERSILGTELEEPKIGRSGREGRGRGGRKRDPWSAMEAHGNLARLASGA